MTTPLYDQTLLIVVRAALQTEANRTAQVADPTTDLNTFTVPLVSLTGTVPVAYVCNWTMTTEQRDRLLAEFGKSFAKSIVPIPVGGRVDLKDDFWLFEAKENQWTLDTVLEVLKMRTMPGESG